MLRRASSYLSSSLHAWQVQAVPASREPGPRNGSLFTRTHLTQFSWLVRKENMTRLTIRFCLVKIGLGYWAVFRSIFLNGGKKGDYFDWWNFVQAIKGMFCIFDREFCVPMVLKRSGRLGGFRLTGTGSTFETQTYWLLKTQSCAAENSSLSERHRCSCELKKYLSFLGFFFLLLQK